MIYPILQLGVRPRYTRMNQRIMLKLLGFNNLHIRSFGTELNASSVKKY